MTHHPTITKLARLDSRGRPLQPGNRYPSGKLKSAPSPFDRGTDQLQAIRRALAGPPDPNDRARGKESMTTTPLDTLRTRGLITEPQWQAGCRYVALRKGYPWPHARCLGAEVASHGHAGEESPRERDAMVRYQQASKELQDRARPAEVSAVCNVVVIQAWDADMLSAQSVPGRAKLQKLRAGLDVLAWHFGLVGRR